MIKKGVVLISDIHFNLNNLEEATSSLLQAISTAGRLNYDLIIAGDLNDTKAILRAEVVNRLLNIFSDIPPSIQVKILVGNHDLINEKGLDNSLNFLNQFPNVEVIYKPTHYKPKGDDQGYYLIPYQTHQEAFRDALEGIPGGSTLIIHQGVLGAFMGDYMQDRSSMNPKELDGYKVYSGHYHRHQTVGPVTYIGSPYTITFGEANDGPKGFLVLHPIGGYEQIPTGLRRHVIVLRDNTNIEIPQEYIGTNDLLWLKVTGPADWLKTLNKEELGQRFIGHSNFRLDLIPTEVKGVILQNIDKTPSEMLDLVIDALAASDERKAALKALAQDLYHENT